MAALTTVSKPLFDDLDALTRTFKTVMVTKKGPIAPRLTDEEITNIFAYGREHLDEMLGKDQGLYHVRPEVTSLARSVTWIKTESGLDFFIHCNKLHKETGGDQPMCPSGGNAEKQLSYAFSCYTRMLCVSAAIKCVISARMDIPFSSKRVSYALSIQRECSGYGVTDISHFDIYAIKAKSRALPSFFKLPPTHKFRFFMKAATCDLFESNPSGLTVSQRLGVVYSILTAIRRLHIECGVVHGDLKPENYLLFKKWNNLFLTDFGAARKKEDSGQSIYLQISPLSLDPEAMIDECTDFTSLKSLDIWQAALSISELFGPHPIYGLFPSTGLPTKDQLSAMLPTLTPNWYSKNYAACLHEKYKDHRDIIEIFINLMDRMLHPKRSERPDIEECTYIIENILKRSEAAESPAKR